MAWSLDRLYLAKRDHGMRKIAAELGVGVATLQRVAVCFVCRQQRPPSKRAVGMTRYRL
jgi:hypothetical protein